MAARSVDRGLRDAFQAVGLDLAGNPRRDRGRALGAFAIPRNAFQVALPVSAAQTTHWLRLALGQPAPLQRPPVAALPEIAIVSIAVLPFDDFSEPSAPPDPYLGDFVTEEITASLTRMRGLLVCARHSASAYRGVAERRARHRRRTRRPLSRRRRHFAKRVGTALQRAPDRRAHRPSYLGGSTGGRCRAGRPPRSHRARDGRASQPARAVAEVLRESGRREPPRDVYAALIGLGPTPARAALRRNLNRALAAARAAVALDPESGEAHAMVAYL